MTRKLNLDILKNKLPGITEGQGYFLWEAIILCLEANGHQSGVTLIVTGKFEEQFQIEWSGKITPEMRQSWGDVKEATEYGAMALAVLIILNLTNFVVSGRSRQGTSVDYFLVSAALSTTPFPEPEAALEVSGILKQRRGNTISMRINDKVKRLQQSGTKNLPTYIVVTEFGQPKTKIIKK